jgi:two-component system response regulator MprA
MAEAVADRLLVVEDEPELRAALARALRSEGYRVVTASDGRVALEVMPAVRPDALVLDVLMPHVNGLELCRRLRADGDHVPVLMLTARDAVGDRVAGLDAGADDYLVKPFALEELFARIRALLRRSRIDEDDDPEVLDFAGLRLDRAARTVSRAGEPLDLTRTEFALLDLLMRNAGTVLAREVILDRIWGYDVSPGSNSLEVFIGYLRRKTELGGHPRLVHTVRGVGYVLRAP